MHLLISSATFLSRFQASSSGRISWTASAPARTRPMTLSILLVAMRGRWRRLRRGSPLGSSHAFLTVGGVLLARPAKIGTSSSEPSTPGLFAPNFAVPKNKTNVSEMVLPMSGFLRYRGRHITCSGCTSAARPGAPTGQAFWSSAVQTKRAVPCVLPTSLSTACYCRKRPGSRVVTVPGPTSSNLKT